MAEQWTIHYRETSDPDPYRVVTAIPDATRERAIERACDMIMKPHLKAAVLRIVGPEGVEITRDALLARCRERQASRV